VRELSKPPGNIAPSAVRITVAGGVQTGRSEALLYVSLSSKWAGKIAQIAVGQYGHISRTQLLALGVPSSTIAYWVVTGGLVRVHIGVYAVGYRRVEPIARAMAAVLACGPGAVLSHDSALALWGLRRWPREPEVIAPRCVRRAGITAHRSRTLTPADTTVQLGVPVTRTARAIDDIRARLTERRHIRLVNAARLERLISAEEAAERLGHGRNPTRSGLEDAFQRWITRHRIPQPLINTPLDGHEVDALWPAEKIIVELDHPATHSDPDTFRQDRRRDRLNREDGYETVRLTGEDLNREEARRLARLVVSRRGA
jgi:very-short-patch-repair endonuclease